MDEQRKSESELVPALRFEGFTDPWEQRKLGEYLCVSAETNKAYEFSREDVLSVSGEYGVVNQVEFQGRSFAGANVSGYGILRTGDLVYTKSPLKTNPYGIIKANLGRSGIVSTLYATYKTKNEANPRFIDVYFSLNPRVNRYLYPLVNKGAKNDMKVSAENAIRGYVVFPSLTEQAEIGALFAKIDSLIALHQRKYEKLKTVKQSLLEKMFPKEGEDVPELRFEGFTEPWEQCKLGEIAHRVTRKNEEGASDLPLTISAQHGLVDQRDFFGSQVASRDMRGYYLLEKGEFAYNKSTSGDSPWGAVKRLARYEKGCLSTLYICFGLDVGDPSFLVTYYETNRWHKGIRLIAAEGARNHGLLNIAPRDFFETELTLPGEIEEQSRIGALFAKLDSLIALHQRELEILKNLKKALLEKMFV